MKRIGNRSVGDFPAAALFLDDLRDIIQLFEDNCTGVTVRAGEYEIDSASEINALASKFPSGRFPDLYIKASGPYVSLDLKSTGAGAYVSDDNPTQMGIIARAREVVSRGRRWSMKSSAWYVPAWIGSGLGGWLLAADQPLPGLAIILVSFGWMFVLSLMGRRELTVYTTERAGHAGFLRRNRDQLVLVLISAVIGGLITYVVTVSVG